MTTNFFRCFCLAGFGLLLRRRDPPDDLPDSDHGGDHQRHPSAAPHHDLDHGGQVDGGPAHPPPLPRPPRVQMHSLSHPGAHSYEGRIYIREYFPLGGLPSGKI